jgi:HAE1 family hydrophobic/amphiphilic exporter-1
LNGVPNEIHDFDAGNDGEASIQVVFNLGTDPNQAAINVQNRASVVNKPPVVVREGENYRSAKYVDVCKLLVRIKNTDKSFCTMQISMFYLN